MKSFSRKYICNYIFILFKVEQEWVPHSASSSLYIRPTMIGTEPTLGVAAATTAELFVLLSPTGPYFATGLKPVNLLADPRYVRAWPGGSGYSKMGSNYAPTLWISVNITTKNSVKFLSSSGKIIEILFREIF